MFNQYATGKKVYSHGAYRPTAGPVSGRGVQGYIQRGLRTAAKKRSLSKFGRDGQSDTRSGVAQAALRRTAKAAPVNRPARPASPVAMASTPIPPKSAGPAGGPVAETGNQSTPGGALPPAQPQVPVMQINPNGTLDLPYDMQATSDLLAQKEAANQALLDLQSSEQQQALDFTTQRRNLDLDYEGLGRETLNRAAGRGTAFSSGYGVAVGDNARDFNNMLGDLLAGNNAFKQDTERRRGGIVNSFNDFIRKEALDRAARLAEQAGSLGYGKSPTKTPETGPANPKVNKPKPKPKPKPKGKPGKPKVGHVKPKAPKKVAIGKPKPKNVKLTPAAVKAAAKRKAAAAKRGK